MTEFANALGRLRVRLAARPDTEHEQAIVRVVVGLVLFLYLLPEALIVAGGDPTASGNTLQWRAAIPPPRAGASGGPPRRAVEGRTSGSCGGLGGARRRVLPRGGGLLEPPLHPRHRLLALPIADGLHQEESQRDGNRQQKRQRRS